MTETAPEEQAQRPLRMCDTCGGVDDHPRHVFAFAPEGDVGGQSANDVAAKAIENAQAISPDALAQVVAQIRDDSTIMRHMDCCREAGCPDGTCNAVTSGAENLRGNDLVAHLTARPQEG